MELAPLSGPASTKASGITLSTETYDLDYLRLRLSHRRAILRECNQHHQQAQDSLHAFRSAVSYDGTIREEHGAGMGHFNARFRSSVCCKMFTIHSLGMCGAPCGCCWFSRATFWKLRIIPYTRLSQVAKVHRMTLRVFGYDTIQWATPVLVLLQFAFFRPALPFNDYNQLPFGMCVLSAFLWLSRNSAIAIKYAYVPKALYDVIMADIGMHEGAWNLLHMWDFADHPSVESMLSLQRMAVAARAGAVHSAAADQFTYRFRTREQATAQAHRIHRCFGVDAQARVRLELQRLHPISKDVVAMRLEHESTGEWCLRIPVLYMSLLSFIAADTELWRKQQQAETRRRASCCWNNWCCRPNALRWWASVLCVLTTLSCYLAPGDTVMHAGPDYSLQSSVLQDFVLDCGFGLADPVGYYGQCKSALEAAASDHHGVLGNVSAACLAPTFESFSGSVVTFSPEFQRDYRQALVGTMRNGMARHLIRCYMCLDPDQAWRRAWHATFSLLACPCVVLFFRVALGFLASSSRILQRRQLQMGFLDALVAPQISLGSLIDPGSSASDPILPLDTPHNIGAYLRSRRIIKLAGSSYFQRAQLIAGFLVLLVLGLLACIWVGTLGVENRSVDLNVIVLTVGMAISLVVAIGVLIRHASSVNFQSEVASRILLRLQMRIHEHALTRLDLDRVAHAQVLATMRDSSQLASELEHARVALKEDYRSDPVRFLGVRADNRLLLLISGALLSAITTISRQFATALAESSRNGMVVIDATGDAG